MTTTARLAMHLASRGAAALALTLALTANAVPASAAAGDLPDLGPDVTVGRLPAGGTVIVRPSAGAPVAAIELWYRAPSTGFGEKPQASVARLAAQTVAASKPLVGPSLGSDVENLGGRLAITVYSDSISIQAVVPASSAKAVVRALTTAYFAPVVTDDGYHAALTDLAQEAFTQSFDPATLVRDDVFAQLFSGGPQHYPVLGGAADLKAITVEQVRQFATRAFRSQNATLVVSGEVDPNIAQSAANGRPDPTAIPEAPSQPVLATSVEPVRKTFVQPTGGYGWIGPAISDERAATAMDFVADYLFRSDVGTVTKAVAAADPQAFVTGQFITLHDPGVMFVVFSGDNVGMLKSYVDAGLNSMRRPLPSGEFAAALAAFKYHLLSDLQTPAEIADNFGWYSVEGDPEYAPGAAGDAGSYFKAANALTPEFVARTVQQYLGKPPAVVALGPGVKPKPPVPEAKPDSKGGTPQ